MCWIRIVKTTLRPATSGYCRVFVTQLTQATTRSGSGGGGGEEKEKTTTGA
jgi:hypothetical protein